MLGYLTKLPALLTRVDTTHAVLADFKSAENRDVIRSTLSDRFQTQSVDHYLAEFLDNAIDDFARNIAAELAESLPIRGTSISDQVAAYNSQFIGHRSRFIHDHVASSPTPMYGVTDGMPTARTNYDRSANDMLASWRTAPGRGIIAREDPQSDIYGSGYGQNISGYSVKTPNERGARESFTSQHPAPTGIVFCDQSAIGTQNHVEQYENTLYKRSLNTYGTHYDTPFGVSNPVADQRLLDRRIFRSNEAGVENGIWRRDARLHGRNLDRDVSEGLRGDSSNHMQRGFDMTGVNKRLEHKAAARAKYEPTRVSPHRPDYGTDFGWR